MFKLSPFIAALALAVAGTAHVQAQGTTGSATGTAGSGTGSSSAGGATTGSASPTSQQPGATKSTGRSNAGTLNAQDRDFIKQAAQNGLAEVEASKLALQKATDAEVKTFAQQMVDDHTQANTQLRQIAQSKNVELPTEPGLMHKAQLKLLGQADGAKFDQRYAAGFGVKAHHDTIELFRKQAERGQDAEIKSFAQSTLPKLQQHMQMAQKLDARLNPDGRQQDARNSADSAKLVNTSSDKATQK